MSDVISGQASPVHQYAGLLKALEWLLPEPVNSSQVAVGRSVDISSHAAPVSISIGADPRDRSTNAYSVRAFPNAENPRLLYPSRGSFRRFSALLRPRSQSLGKRIASKMLESMPQWVEKRSVPIVVEVEQESTLLQLLHEFCEPESMAIYIGYRDGLPRPTIWGFDERGTVNTIAKYASGVSEAHSLRKESQMLNTLNNMDRFVGRVPRLLGIKQGHLGDMLVTDAFDGEPGPRTINAAIQQWLMDCIVGPEMAIGASSLFVELREKASEQGGVALEAVVSAHEQLKDTLVPATIVHGDFTPWNILMDADAVRVFDWETATADGFPEWDRVFYMFRPALMGKVWSPERLLGELKLQARNGSEFYSHSEWKAVLTISLVSLLINEPRGRRSRAVLEDVLMEIVKDWWT